MNDRGLEIHSSTLDRVADEKKNVRVCQFLSTSIDNRLDGQDDAEFRKRNGGWAGLQNGRLRQLVLGWKMEKKGCPIIQLNRAGQRAVRQVTRVHNGG